MRQRRKQWIGFLVMVLGAALLLGPFVQGDLETRKQEDYVAELREQMSRVTATPVLAATLVPTEVPVPTEQSAPTDTPEPTKAPAPSEAPVLTEAAVSTAAPAPTDMPVPTAAPAPTDTPVLTVEVDPTRTPGTTVIATAHLSTAIPADTDAPLTTAEPMASASAAPTAEHTATAAPAATPVPVAVELSTAIEATATPEPQDPFFQEALAYNRSLVINGQDDMNTSDDLQGFKVRAQKYGYKDNVIGTISIPKLGVEVPLYLGATNEHMSNGFAVFGMTSIPLGLGDENVAIAGHRGWRGAAMLRDVQMLMMGDPVYITTPWATLTYIVNGIEIVTPTNVNWCKLKPGKTMISLMTCHPYGQHTHRYIVYAELQTEEPDSQTNVFSSNAAAAASGAAAGLSVGDTQAVNRFAMPVPTVTAAPVITIAPTAVTELTATPVVTAEPTWTPAAAVEPTASAVVIAEQTELPAITAEPTAAAAKTTEPTAAITTEPTETPSFTEAPVITCTPIALHRSLLSDLAANREAATRVATDAPVSKAQEIVLVHEDGVREVILMDTEALDPDDREYSTEWSNTLILAENNMRPVAYVTAGVVALVGLWLVIATIRDAKNEKRGKHDDEE